MKIISLKLRKWSTNSRIKERVPMLYPHTVGFQCLRKDDDGTEGDGVMIYAIGTQPVYVPSFFRNGELNTGVVMILPGKNMVLPVDEVWTSWARELSGDLSVDIATSTERRFAQGGSPESSITGSGDMGIPWNRQPRQLPDSRLRHCIEKLSRNPVYTKDPLMLWNYYRHGQDRLRG